MSIGELPPVNLGDINERLNQLENEVDGLNTAFDTLVMEIIFPMMGSLNNLSAQVNNLNNTVNNLSNQLNNLQQRMTDVEQNIVYLSNRITNIESQLSNFLTKASPIPGYNPYNLTGTITAKVWMYEITPINDENVKFYYVQFNQISGPSGGLSSWVPMPSGTFRHFLYTYHSDFHIGALVPGAPTVPAAYSARGHSYRLQISSNEDSFRLVINAGSPGGDDYIGFLVIGNK